MIRVRKTFTTAFFAFFAACSFLFAEKIRFTADSMSGQAGNSSTTTTMNGNASVNTESIEIKADMLQLSGEDYRNISAEGNVKGKNLETNMEFSCESLSYDRITKQIILKGNVSLIDIDNEVECGAQIIEYDQEKDVAIMQIQISLTQKDNVSSGSYAVYYKERQVLEISGNAQVKQKSDTFRAQFITLDLETQDITLGGNVKGTVTSTKDEEKTEAEKGDAEAEKEADSGVEGGLESGDGKVKPSDEEKTDDGAEDKTSAAGENAFGGAEEKTSFGEEAASSLKKSKKGKSKN